MKVTLQVDGRQMTFSKVENIQISEETVQSEKEKSNNGGTVSFIDHPLVNEGWFYVYPRAIDRAFFEKEVEEKAVQTRDFILEALEKVRKYPYLYDNDIKVRIPKDVFQYRDKSYDVIIAELSENNEYLIDWVELALIWAQRIKDGEGWDMLYNTNFNVSNYHRFIRWKGNQIATVGGSLAPYVFNYPEQYISPIIKSRDKKNRWGVPIIAKRVV